MIIQNYFNFVLRRRQCLIAYIDTCKENIVTHYVIFLSTISNYKISIEEQYL
jgi:hypothetical protein